MICQSAISRCSQEMSLSLRSGVSPGQLGQRRHGLSRRPQDLLG